MREAAIPEPFPGRDEWAALSMLDALPDVSVLVLDRGLRCVLAAGTALERHGFDGPTAEGRLAERVLGTRWEEYEPLCRAALAGESGKTEFEDQLDGAGRRLQVGPLRDADRTIVGCVTLMSDLAPDDRERTRDEELNARLTRIYALVMQAHSGVITHSSPHEMYARLCELAVREGGFSLAWVGELNRATSEVRVVAASGVTRYLEGIKISVRAGEPTASGPTGTALRERRVVCCNDIATCEEMAPWRERAQAYGFAASAAFPLLDDDFAPTALMVYAPRAGFFADQELELLQYLASDTAIVLRTRLRDAERFRLALAGSGMTAFTMDQELRYTWIENPSLGVAAETALGRTDAELMGELSAARVTERKRRVLDDGESIDEEVSVVQGTDTLWLRLTAHPLRDPAGNVIGLAGQSTDITDYVHARQRERDAQEFLAAITESMAEGMFALDADGRLTYINEAGQQILGWSDEQLGGRLMHDAIHYRRPDGHHYPASECRLLAAVRSGDTVRVEEDSFVHRDGHPIAVAYSVAPMMLGGSRGSVVVFSDITERKAEQARQAAEQEMITWVGRIRDALDDERFVLYAQPIVDLQTSEVVQHELLIRMLDPRGGEVIAPARFLPAAEKYGLISEIDEWVIQQAAWLAGAGHPVEFNLSASSLAKPQIVGSIVRAFREAGARATDVVCEITETALLREAQVGRAFAEHLSSLGFGIALDDFGTGYGGLTYLTALPLTHVKIDSSFVTDLASSEANQHVVRAIVSLAKGFNKITVAEGVEDGETLALLREIGVDHAQGYYLGRPAPLPQVLGGPPK
jgi:PAS domain S-box-containing protein